MVRNQNYGESQNHEAETNRSHDEREADIG